TFGANWLRPIQNVYGPPLGDGSFSFTGQTTGLALSDFLAGAVTTFSQQGIQYDNERYQYFGAYAQDTWKATSHLTVNYGLRWEPYIGGSMATAVGSQHSETNGLELAVLGELFRKQHNSFVGGCAGECGRVHSRYFHAGHRESTPRAVFTESFARPIFRLDLLARRWLNGELRRLVADRAASA